MNFNCKIKSRQKQFFIFQDRCHRIGQTRDVHIYRLVSERSVEENILKKANQKRLLGDIAIEGGNFTTAHFKKSTIRDLFDVEEETTLVDDDVVIEGNDESNVAGGGNPEEGVKKKIDIFESALAAVEENTDVEANKIFH
jgi:E1A-binding protein p400